ncbi:MAG: L,D-transpeptidase [Burkholderiaceae bacterium]
MLLAVLLGAGGPSAQAQPLQQPADLAARFEQEVDRRLALPAQEQAFYAARLREALAATPLQRTQFVLLVDRSASVQAAMIWWLAADGSAGLVGASPASTGRPSGFEHFETPLGVFEHALANPDFRAEGTRNAFGIRGYGDKGLRVYDFGWVTAPRAWAPGEQAMRLQLHATDRALLEPRLGRRESKGCIRIPTTMNIFIDRHGVLDAAYDEALAEGHSFWVLRSDREPTPWSGRWLVVIDSKRSERPAWSPAPGRTPGAVTARVAQRSAC